MKIHSISNLMAVIVVILYASIDDSKLSTPSHMCIGNTCDSVTIVRATTHRTLDINCSLTNAILPENLKGLMKMVRIISHNYIILFGYANQKISSFILKYDLYLSISA